jgi:hypothetical protein
VCAVLWLSTLCHNILINIRDKKDRVTTIMHQLTSESKANNLNEDSKHWIMFLKLESFVTAKPMMKM